MLTKNGSRSSRSNQPALSPIEGFNRFAPFKALRRFKVQKFNVQSNFEAVSKVSVVPSLNNWEQNHSISTTSNEETAKTLTEFSHTRETNKKTESRGTKWRCSDCGCTGFQSGCVVVTKEGMQSGSV
jgi:hypothetical protein